MSLSVALLNLALGAIYTSYGLITIADLRRGWTTRGELHFGLSWIAMAFTCGPHHLEHGLHTLLGLRDGGPLDMLAVVVGAPAGVTWFLLRVEAFRGGRGDREVDGAARWVRALPWVFGAYVVVVTLAAVGLQRDASWRPVLAPNVWLFALYMVIGFYLLRTQLQTRKDAGSWSLSGVCLTVVFPTCAMMHVVWLVYAAAGRYRVDGHLLAIDWLGVPAALYFVWVVRALFRGELSTPSERLPAVLAA